MATTKVSGELVDLRGGLPDFSLAATNTVSYLNAGGGNQYNFNGAYGLYGVVNGTYVLSSVSSSHPIAILNNGKTSLISYTGAVNEGSQTGPDGNTYTYYSGDVTITVSGNFDVVSYACKVHGYMGGQNNLIYTNLHSDLGLKIPSGTEINRPATDVAGMVRNNTNEASEGSASCEEYYNGAAWKKINNVAIPPIVGMSTLIYSGNGSTQSLTGLGFKPDLVWAKMINSSQRNFLTDTSRGINKHLFSDFTTAEETDSSMGNTNPIYTAFNDDGFVFGTSGSGPNDSSRQYVAWCWKGAGGVNASNSEGSTTCSTQANTKSGFSIITYTGTGSAATLGHGLEKAPEFIMAKRRSSADQTWKNYHVGMGPTKYLTLNEADAAGTSSGMWNDTAPTDTLIHIGNESNVSTSSKDYVIYAWHGVEGYSKFGNYEGNGNNDGPFIYTGFRPRMIFFKWYETAASAEPWGVFDTARATYNPTSAHSYGQVYWNTTAAGSTGSTHGVDFLSNGVKLRGNGGLHNANGGQYIYGAWGDVPFKYNNTF